MGLNTLVRSRWFRNFMAKLYGWGASVVILGALFKINHYTGADIMLIIGLGTEAIIFFFSAFEPPHVEPDWSLVYPELAGMYHDEDEAKRPTEALDDMLSEANIEQSLIDRLGTGLRNLSDNASKLSDISDAAGVTQEYVQNVKSASDSASELSDAYKGTSEALQRDANASAEYVSNLKSASDGAAALTSSYREASESLQTDSNATQEFTNSIQAAMASANTLAEQYSRSAAILASSAEQLDMSALDGGAYAEQLQKISSNLAALNAVYELQLQSSNEQVETSSKVRETMSEYVSALNESAQLMSSYKDQMGVLTDRISALNNIYGGMLSAMNAPK